MSQGRYRAGILGAGYISSFHADAIASLPNVDLVAVCDTNEQAAKRLAVQYSGVDVSTDFAAMLEAGKIDVVHVLTQPDSHFALAKMAIEAGCDVIMEKPVTASAAEARELREIAATANRKIAVNHNFLFSRPFIKLAALLESGRLGPLKSVRIVWKQMLAQMYSGPWDLWMLRDSQNILFESGAHSLSELLAVLDTPTEFDYVAARMPKELPSGAEFFRRWSIAGHAGDVAVSIETAFDHGFPQHFVEVEGLFGVARADIMQDVLMTDLPTGRLYDAERLHANVRAGISRAAQACRTYASFAGSKFLKSASGNPYNASMRFGIVNCYEQLAGSAQRRGSDIDFAVGVAEAAEAVAAKLPKRVLRQEAPEAAIPPVVSKPEKDCSILIVGATGFIGRGLFVELQKRGVGVRAIVRNRSKLVGVELNEHSEILLGDFRDADLMASALEGIETVYHLAVAHGKSFEEYQRFDVDPTIEFARQCQARGIKRFVYTGTIDSLDLAHSHSLTEANGLDEHLARRNNYAHSKGLAENLLLDMHEREGFPVVIVRPAIVLGPGGPVTHLGVANWFGIGSCAYWGDGRNLIPAVLVDDIVDGLIRVMETADIDGNTYNLSAEPCISARDYVEQVEKALDLRIDARSSNSFSNFAGDFTKWCVKMLARHPDRSRIPSLHDWKCREQHASFDTTKAQQDLGWRPTNDRGTIINKGIHEPAQQAFDS